ncbi:hypothetical protein B0H34DRAFT_330928 [Crassisporium funariophilum]|nr:hypothetical protein B0H34DRAFT_330928 [Crassisporium funariophilum]
MTASTQFSHAHERRMVKLKARAVATSENVPEATYTPAGTAVAASTDKPAAPSTVVPVTSPVIAAIVAFLVIAVALIFAVYFFGRRRRLKNFSKAPSANVDRNEFSDRKSKLNPGYDKHIVSDLTKHAVLYNVPRRQEQEPKSASSSKSSDSTTGRHPRTMPTPLRVTNIDEIGTRFPTPTTSTYPSPGVKKNAEKERPPRSKPKRLDAIATDVESLRSPPPAYALSSAVEDFLVPIPARLQPQKLRRTPTPPTPPANRKTHAASPAQASAQFLYVPQEQEPIPVISPSRSESFAPKDLMLPTPPSSSYSGLDSNGSRPNSSRDDYVTEFRLPRLMSVIAPFTPNLEDELSVRAGDIVRIIEEYRDGWCFVQYVGKRDAPRGVVPLVCLQERKRIVPFTHQVSNSSLTSLNWR